MMAAGVASRPSEIPWKVDTQCLGLSWLLEHLFNKNVNEMK